eukprot:SAG31_NODE_4247_length_3420_cov_2.633243_5_plen_561_part_01
MCVTRQIYGDEQKRQTVQLIFECHFRVASTGYSRMVACCAARTAGAGPHRASCRRHVAPRAEKNASPQPALAAAQTRTDKQDRQTCVPDQESGGQDGRALADQCTEIGEPEDDSNEDAEFEPALSVELREPVAQPRSQKAPVAIGGSDDCDDDDSDDDEFQDVPTLADGGKIHRPETCFLPVPKPPKPRRLNSVPVRRQPAQTQSPSKAGAEQLIEPQFADASDASAAVMPRMGARRTAVPPNTATHSLRSPVPFRPRKPAVNPVCDLCGAATKRCKCVGASRVGQDETAQLFPPTSPPVSSKSTLQALRLVPSLAVAFDEAELLEMAKSARFLARPAVRTKLAYTELCSWKAQVGLLSILMWPCIQGSIVAPPAETLLIIVAGMILPQKRVGDQLEPTRLGPGSWTGAQEWLLGSAAAAGVAEQRDASVTCVTPCTMFTVPREALAPVLLAKPRASVLLGNMLRHDGALDNAAQICNAFGILSRNADQPGAPSLGGRTLSNSTTNITPAVTVSSKDDKNLLPAITTVTEQIHALDKQILNTENAQAVFLQRLARDDAQR